MTTMTLAWTITAWPPVLWQADPLPHKRMASRFVHLGTQVTTQGNGVKPAAGQTIWGSKLAQGQAGVAWDWVDLGHGVVAMADPMGFVTNLQIVNDRGDHLPCLQVALHINEIVHELPWQAEVRLALSQPTSPA
jgi:hypothetical protein